MRDEETARPGDPSGGKLKTVLFVCTHNSGRSQMAEAYVNHWYSKRFQAFSAGTEPSELNPYVIEAMAEEGIDLSGHRSKDVSEFAQRDFDYVVTVCDHARESCPYFPGGGQRLHRSFDDPSRCAGSGPDILTCVRRIRDDIRRWLFEFFGEPSP